jgi:hypothetical protein
VKNTADVAGGKPIAVLLQSISGVSAINPLVAFYDIHGGKREALFFYFVPDTTRDPTRHEINTVYSLIITIYCQVYYSIKAHLQEIVRCSFKLKLDLDVIPSLSN